MHCSLNATYMEATPGLNLIRKHLCETDVVQKEEPMPRSTVPCGRMPAFPRACTEMDLNVGRGKVERHAPLGIGSCRLGVMERI